MAASVATPVVTKRSTRKPRSVPSANRVFLPLVVGALGTATILAIWELLVIMGVIGTRALPQPTEIITALFGLLGSGSYWSAIGATLFSAFVGVLIALAWATPIAIVVGRSTSIRVQTGGLIEFLKPIPPIALLPLALLFWGPTETMKLALIVYGAFWPLLTQLIDGIKEVDEAALDMARTHRLSRRRIIQYIVVPSMLPFALTGIRVSISIGLVVSIVTEMIGGASGLGQQIAVAHSSHALPLMYALITTTGILGIALSQIIQALERPILFWHPSQRNQKGE